MAENDAVKASPGFALAGSICNPVITGRTFRSQLNCQPRMISVHTVCRVVAKAAPVAATAYSTVSSVGPVLSPVRSSRGACRRAQQELARVWQALRVAFEGRRRGKRIRSSETVAVDAAAADVVVITSRSETYRAAVTLIVWMVLACVTVATASVMGHVVSLELATRVTATSNDPTIASQADRYARLPRAALDLVEVSADMVDRQSEVPNQTTETDAASRRHRRRSDVPLASGRYC